MENASRTTQRREESLSRERIIEASIELLDSNGEGGLTFRTLSERLATGAGAIYWHIANKSDLLTAACDSIIARTVDACSTDGLPEESIRALALGIFDTFEAHPWVGSVLTAAPGRLPIVRIVEGLGRQLDVLGVPGKEQWATVSALLNYILGVAGQNAANSLLAKQVGADRSGFLDAVATAWSQLDEGGYPFVRGIAEQLRTHDDRVDFLAGIDIILRGIRR
ncbi:MAG: TetR family transcriptional regulator [Verrucomicrobiaceae bacterium]|nr:MAG: TetR family transcriptional regulator [Verrucomicrobiaceae bacterium]